MVIIVGGGISGLSAALRICQLKPGSSVTILESASRVGGWISSTRHENGSVFEHGPRTLRPVGESGMATLGLIETLGLQEKVMSVAKWHPSARNRLIYADGKLHTLPNNLSSIFKKIPPFSKPLYYAGIRDLVARRGPKGDESMHSFVLRRFGGDVADYLIDPLIRGICAGDAREISVKFLLKDLKESEIQHRSVVLSTIRKLLFKRKRVQAAKPEPELAQKARSEGWSVWTLQGGLQTLTDSLVERLQKEGVEIKLNSKISSLKIREGRALIKLENGEEMETDYVISSVPAYALAPALKESQPELSNILGDIKSVTVGMANFEYPRKDILDLEAFGFLVPSSQDLPVLGVVFDTCSFPQGDKTILTVMYGGHRYQPTTLQQLEDISKMALAKTLNITEEPSQKHIQILDKCIPQYTVGHHQRVKDLEALISREKLPLSLIGASYKGVSVNDCVLHSMNAVDELFKR